MLVPVVTSRGGTGIILGSCIDHTHHTGFNVDQSPVLREHVQNWPLVALALLDISGTQAFSLHKLGMACDPEGYSMQLSARRRDCWFLVSPEGMLCLAFVACVGRLSCASVKS